MTTQKPMYHLKLAWLYPDLMSTYGDRGNIIVMKKRCEWRGIKVDILPISVGDDFKLLSTVDFILMGGAEDRQQKIVSFDFKKGKDESLKDKVFGETPGLFICGAYQFLGKYYKEADGTIIQGLGILDISTEHPGVMTERLIGNIAAETSIIETTDGSNKILLGFENHGGRTYLGKGVSPFAKIKVGFGNNGKDLTEGALFHNTIGTYLHGPILSKNPKLADWFIQKSLEVKYGENVKLQSLDDSLEQLAREVIAKRIRIQL